ncbi:sortase domain-containing protein [Terrabacter sp. 2RAF25]|uniref:sortase domain-containing protein n=1 Tax=Terrabacter sp. 2RAF25 TaxID=3232998 RepID=UPI003F9DD141
MTDQPGTSGRSNQPSPSGRMPSQQGRRVTTGVAAALLATAVLLAVGVVALVIGIRGPSGSPAPAPPAPPAAAPAPATPGAPSTATSTSRTPAKGPATTAPTRPTSDPGAAFGRFLDASEPTSLEIPSIGVGSRTFVPLRIQRDGTISVPGTAQEVGLYDAGPTPGQLGPSVIAAHVDTPAGVPGIFHELGRVKAGDVVEVARQDGSHLTFTVDRVAAYRKSQFPTDLVYKSDFRRAEIRLVTCGGPTDSRNEYRDNVIVFGHLASAA